MNKNLWWFLHFEYLGNNYMDFLNSYNFFLATALINENVDAVLQKHQC